MKVGLPTCVTLFKSGAGYFARGWNHSRYATTPITYRMPFDKLLAIGAIRPLKDFVPMSLFLQAEMECGSQQRYPL